MTRGTPSLMHDPLPLSAPNGHSLFESLALFELFVLTSANGWDKSDELNKALVDHQWVEATRSSYRTECAWCGERVRLKTDGSSIAAIDPCPYPGGLPCSFDLFVPSGQLVVANDLRDRFSVDETGMSVNTAAGCVQVTLAYAEVGMAHAFVGNTCPSLYRVDDEHYHVSAVDDESNAPDRPNLQGLFPDFPTDRGSEVASICTDLWWYSIMDADVFASLGGVVDDYMALVDVKPGVYRFDHLAHLADFDRDTYPVRFTNITWSPLLEG